MTAAQLALDGSTRPPICPGCGDAAAPDSYPPRAQGASGRPPAPWWCTSCLRERVAAAHGTDCRCGGCTRAGRPVRSIA